jgi:hypothetical protein
MKRISLTLALLLLAARALVAEPTAAVPANAPTVDPMAEALPVLQARYIDFAGLHYQSGDRLADLVARSAGKISVMMPGTTVSAPILTAALPDAVVYWRLASFAPRKDWAGLGDDLKTMIDAQHVSGAILDLRANASDDYAGAAQVLGFFVPGDSSLLKYIPPDKTDATRTRVSVAERHFDGPIVVLTNGQTAGAAEALAGCLKSDGGLVVGQPTAGTGFEDHPLSNGQTLHFAVALPARAGDTMIRPVVPDLALNVEERNESAALMLIREGRILDVIQESSERRRMSEASLVNGQDPEWDSYLATLENGSALLSLPRIHDPVLVTALDSLRAIRLSERAAPVEAASNTTHTAGTSVQ